MLFVFISVFEKSRDVNLIEKIKNKSEIQSNIYKFKLNLIDLKNDRFELKTIVLNSKLSCLPSKYIDSFLTWKIDLLSNI